MVSEFVMPRLSETQDTGTIVEWFVKEGEPVRKGGRLVAVETDKAVVEVESPQDGWLGRILFDRGASVAYQTVLALLAQSPDEALPEIDPYHRQKEIAREVAPAARPQGAEVAQADLERTLASPVAVRLAHERGIDLRTIVGTGPGGRITRDDVLNAASVPKRPSEARASRRIPLSKMRKAIAASMAHSKEAIPHAYVQLEVDVSQVVALRERLGSGEQGVEPMGCTYTDILVKAVALALREFPSLNSTFCGEEIEVWEEINIGVAVSLDDDGLIVPVIRNADRKSIVEIAATSSELIARAREKRLSLAEYTGGTFTITNLGMYGVDNFLAIINPPESAILAVGAIKKKAIVIDDQVVVRPMMAMTLSADHRVADGVLTARFLRRLESILSDAEALLHSAAPRG